MTVSHMNLQKGDIIRLSTPNGDVLREITAVRRTGYTWKYPGNSTEEWWSENSNDPFFIWGWELFNRKDD